MSKWVLYSNKVYVLVIIESNHDYKNKEDRLVVGINVRCQVLTRFWFGLKTPTNRREHELVFLCLLFS